MVAAKDILRLSVPVAFSALLLPLSGLLDSVLVPRLLNGYAADAVGLYGLFSGGAVTIINLPVSVCYGVAAASIPAVARATARRKEGENPRKRIFFSLFVTVVVSIPAAAGLYFFAEPAVQLVFRNLAAEEVATLVSLVKIFAISAVSLSLTQTLSACLTAQGKPQYAALSMLIAVTVKTGLYVWWLQNPQISIYGLAYATNICYLVAFFLDFVYNLVVSRKGKE